MRDGIGFGGVFLAVFMALIAHDIVRLAVARLGLERTVQQLTAQPLSRPASPAAAAAPSRALERLPGPAIDLAGPVEARRLGHTFACINGVYAIRNSNGWSDVGPRTGCVATTQ